MILVNKNTDVPVDLIHYGLVAIERVFGGFVLYFKSDVDRFVSLQRLLNFSSLYISPQAPGLCLSIEELTYIGVSNHARDTFYVYRIPNWDLRYNSKILLKDV